jgi:hypothetical protein
MPYFRGRKKIKHISLKTLRKKAWDLQSKYIRQSERGICFTCGVHKDWKEMDCGHYIHRDSLDYNPINNHCQCTYCNRFLHGNLGVYAERLINEYGESVIAELREESRKIKKFGVDELNEIISTYKQRLNQLTQEALNG